MPEMREAPNVSRAFTKSHDTPGAWRKDRERELQTSLLSLPRGKTRNKRSAIKVDTTVCIVYNTVTKEIKLCTLKQVGKERGDYILT